MSASINSILRSDDYWQGYHEGYRDGVEASKKQEVTLSSLVLKRDSREKLFCRARNYFFSRRGSQWRKRKSNYLFICIERRITRKLFRRQPTFSRRNLREHSLGKKNHFTV